MTHPIPEAALNTASAIIGRKDRVCRQCRISFRVRRPSESGIYCSHKCNGLAKRTLQNALVRECPACRKAFTPERKRSGQRFCSRACALLTYHTPEHQSAAGKVSAAVQSSRLRGNGTKAPYIKRDGRHEHRVVAEEKLGRQLMPGEVVHHIDEDGKNNAPDNISVFNSQAEHARHHFTGKKQSQDHVRKRVISRLETIKSRGGTQ